MEKIKCLRGRGQIVGSSPTGSGGGAYDAFREVHGLSLGPPEGDVVGGLIPEGALNGFWVEAASRPRYRSCSTAVPQVAPVSAGGWFICSLRWPVEGGDELFEGPLSGLGFGQSGLDAAGAGGNAGRRVHHPGSGGAGAGSCERASGKDSRGADEVVSQHRTGRPSEVGSDMPRRQVVPGTVLQIGVGLGSPVRCKWCWRWSTVRSGRAHQSTRDPSPASGSRGPR